MSLNRIFLIVALLMLVSPRMAEAQACSFSATDINLGSVDVLGSAPTTASGNITINCGLFSFPQSETIHVGEGVAGHTGNQRRMTSSTTSTGLSYNLFQNSSGTTVFGGSYGTFGGSPMVLDGLFFSVAVIGFPISVPFYARVPANQTGVFPGSYRSDFTRDPIDVRVEYRTCTILCTNRTATFTFAVRATVQPNCLVQADPLNFGTHGQLNDPVDATSQFRATCTAGTPFNMGVSYGLSGTSPGTRALRNSAGGRVAYNLFRDAARTLPWGLAADGMGLISSGTGLSQTERVYGRVPAQATPNPGIYADTVNVVLTY